MPAVMEYDDARPIPAGSHVVVRTNYEWVAGGFAFFGLTYGTTIYVAALVGADGYHHPKVESLYYPIVGPFMAMHDLDSKGAGTFWLAVDGLCQLGGVVAGIYGLASPTKSLYRNDLRNGHVQLAPLVAASGAGLQVFGAF